MLKYDENMKIHIFHKFILNMNTSLFMRFTCLKIIIHVLNRQLEGRVSQKVLVLL